MMVKNFNIKFLTLLLVSVFYTGLSAQVNWEPVILDVAGHTVVKKVAVFFQKTVCQNEDYIVIKFVNDNDYPVTVKWYDAVQLNSDYSWVKKYDSTPKKVLEIPAKSEIKGVCSSQDNQDCVIQLKDFIGNPLLYKSYAMYRFEIPNIK
jgi:hypothetical protein